LGELDTVIFTIDNFKPWTAYNQTYIDTFIEDTRRDYKEVQDHLHPYDEGEWNNETLIKKVFNYDGDDLPWEHYWDNTKFETEREF